MQALRSHGENLWTVDDPSFRLLGIAPIGTRMAIVRLKSGRLVLISPIQLSRTLQDEIEGLGNVGYIVSPNRVHHLFAQAAKEAYPTAVLLAPPGLAEKKPKLSFDGLVGGAPVKDWEDELDTYLIRGFPFLDEVVFFHRDDRTLILTDLCFNLRRTNSSFFRIAFQTNDMWDRFGPSRIFRRLIRDRSALRQSIDKILDWDFNRVIVAHGDILESGGPDALREAYAFLR